MKILGIDLGIRRTGLALASEFGLGIRLLSPVSVKNQAQLIELICGLVLEEEINQIVIGIPESRSPASITIATRALSLKAALEERFVRMPWSMKIVLIDETQSSKEGLKRLIASGASRSMRKEKIDSAAAAVIIEEYILMAKDQTCSGYH